MQDRKTTLTAAVIKRSAEFVDHLVLLGIDRGVAGPLVEDFAHSIAGKRPRKAVQDPNHALFVAIYSAKYREKYKSDPALPPGTYSVAARITKISKAEIIRAVMTRFFADPYYEKSGYSVFAFERAWPSLFAKVKGQYAHATSQRAEQSETYLSGLRSGSGHS